MRRTGLDFDVISGPVEPRPAPDLPKASAPDTVDGAIALGAREMNARLARGLSGAVVRATA